MYGVNIMMRDKLLIGICLFLAGLFWACGSDEGEEASSGDERTYADDRAEIEATLEETAHRWRYGDKAILYEQEFEYYRIENTYDDYLEIDRIKRMESDTVETFKVRDIKFYDRDSALVSVDVVFVGPTGDTTHYYQDWLMHYHRGRWIRPTMSNYISQESFEEIRRKADSAAQAEEEEEEEW